MVQATDFQIKVRARVYVLDGFPIEENVWKMEIYV